jgi:ATP-dependent Clp protease adaptor protein ClpS
VSTQPLNAPDVDVDVATRTDDVWVTLVWNDPVNLMSYVTHVFQSHFGWTRAEAERRMREVHELGKSVVSSGSREHMEVDVQAMHSYGLWATLRRSGE